MSARGAAPAPSSIRLDPRHKYLSLALMALQRAVAYRATTCFNLLAGLVTAAVFYSLWAAVFAAQPHVQGYDWDRMRTYVVVAYAVNALLSFFHELRLYRLIRSGEVAVELMRPLDYQTARLAEAAGAALLEGLFAGALALAVGLLVLRIDLPASPAAVPAFAVSVLLGFVVKFLISYLTALLMFRTRHVAGLIWARGAVTNILSGALIPLAFFPDWLRAVALAMPFHAVAAAPVSIYVGEAHGAALWSALGVQALWAVALWLLARLAWGPAVRALTVHGG